MLWSPAGPGPGPGPGSLSRLVAEHTGLPQQTALAHVSSHTSGLNQLQTHRHTRER